jgi:hypothetical protein
VERDGFYEMNVDKGNQSNRVQMHRSSATSESNPDDCSGKPKYVLKNFKSEPFLVNADAAGNLWLFFGPIPGFEGTTRSTSRKFVQP